MVSNLLWIFLEYPLKKLDINSINKADAIVILSGGNQSSRYSSGIELYKAKKARKLIFTGGINPYSGDLTPRGDILIEKALSTGIPRNDLYTTKTVLNTYQEAKAIKNLIKEKINLGSKNVILVTTAFHMKRAKKVLERQGITVQPYPVDFKKINFKNTLANPLSWIPNASDLGKSSFAVREIIGRLYYRIW